MQINSNEYGRSSMLSSPALLSPTSAAVKALPSFKLSSTQSNTNNKLLNVPANRMKPSLSVMSNSTTAATSSSSSSTSSSYSSTSSSSIRLRNSMLLQTAYMGCHYESIRQDENWMRFRKKIDDEQCDVCVKWVNLQFSRLLYDSHGVISQEAKDTYSWLVVTDLGKDFCDGLRLIYLIEILYQVKLSKEAGSKKFGCLKLHKVKNHETCLNFLQNHVKLKCVGINPLDLVEGNMKMIISLLFLIRHDFENRFYKEQQQDNQTDCSNLRETSDRSNIRTPKALPGENKLIGINNNKSWSQSQMQINMASSSSSKGQISTNKRSKYMSSAQYPSVSYLIDELNARTNCEISTSKNSLTTKQTNYQVMSSLQVPAIVSGVSCSKVDQLYTAYLNNNHSSSNSLSSPSENLSSSSRSSHIISKSETVYNELQFHQVNEVQSEILYDLSLSEERDCITKTMHYPEILELKHDYAAELDHDLTDSGYSNNMMPACCGDEKRSSKSDSLESIDSKIPDKQDDEVYSQSEIYLTAETRKAEELIYLNNNSGYSADQFEDNSSVNNLEIWSDINEFIEGDSSFLASDVDVASASGINPPPELAVHVEIVNNTVHINVNDSTKPVDIYLPTVETQSEDLEAKQLLRSNSAEHIRPEIDIQELNFILNDLIEQIIREEIVSVEQSNKIEAILIEANNKDEAKEKEQDYDDYDDDDDDDDDDDEDDENTETVIFNSSFVDPDEADDYKFENIEFEEKIRDLDELLENQLQHELDKISKDEQLLEILNENLASEKDNLKEIEQMLSKQVDDSTTSNSMIENLMLDYDEIKPSGYSSCLLDMIASEKIDIINLSQLKENEAKKSSNSSSHEILFNTENNMISADSQENVHHENKANDNLLVSDSTKSGELDMSIEALLSHIGQEIVVILEPEKVPQNEYVLDDCLDEKKMNKSECQSISLIEFEKQNIPLPSQLVGSHIEFVNSDLTAIQNLGIEVVHDHLKIEEIEFQNTNVTKSEENSNCALLDASIRSELNLNNQQQITELPDGDYTEEKGEELKGNSDMLEVEKISVRTFQEKNFINKEIYQVYGKTEETMPNNNNNNDDDGIQLEDEEVEDDQMPSDRSRTHSNSSNSSRSTLSSNSNNNIKDGVENLKKSFSKEKSAQLVITESEFQEQVNSKNSYATILLNRSVQAANNNSFKEPNGHTAASQSPKTYRESKIKQKVKLNVIPIEIKEKSQNGKLKYSNETVIVATSSLIKPPEIKSDTKNHFNTNPVEEKSQGKLKSFLRELILIKYIIYFNK